jgi:hypothetical protein
MSEIKSKVMTMANNYVKRGMNRRAAMLKAWIIAKTSTFRTKVKGTSRRQEALEQLSKLNPDEISVKLKREPHNSYDSNAIAVYAVSSGLHALYRLFVKGGSERVSPLIR